MLEDGALLRWWGPGGLVYLFQEGKTGEKGEKRIPL